MPQFNDLRQFFRRCPALLRAVGSLEFRFRQFDLVIEHILGHIFHGNCLFRENGQTLRANVGYLKYSGKPTWNPF